MNSYRTRTPNVSGIAVLLVVLLAIGAIVASIVLGPKPNTTVVNLQPIRPAQTAPVPTTATQPNVDQPSADPVASIPPEELPVIESRPTQPVQDQASVQDQVIEQSELGTEPSQATTPTDTNPSPSQSRASSTTPNASSSVAASRDSNSSVQSTTPRESTVTSTPTRTTSVQSRATTTASTSTTTSNSGKPAAPSAFLRRSTNGVSVQVGAFRSVDSAAKLAQELARKGFTASVQPSGGLYRVVIGPYKDDATARAAAARAR